MPMELNFGLMGGAAPSKTANAGAPFRIAVLGDFSAGATGFDPPGVDGLCAAVPADIA